MKHTAYQFGRLLLLCLALGLPVHTQTPAPTSGSAITGRIVTADGQPLPDVAVTLLQMGGGGNSSSRSTFSDDEGEFSFSGLTGRQYAVSAFAPGFTIQRSSASTLRPGDAVTLTLIKGGIITGRVTNAQGEPVVAVSVAVQMIRTADGRRVDGNAEHSQLTDDRGIYRLYGLREGIYLVVANAPSGYAAPLSAYQRETPTYHPAADRATAQEVTVRLGEEATGIDIRYRGERGHQISGKIMGAIEFANATQGGINIRLKQAGSETSYNNITLRASGSELDFVFDAIPDGEYELIAQRYEARDSLAQTTPRRVQVKGADVRDLTLTLVPLGSLTGRVRLATAPANSTSASKCTPAKPPVLPVLEEIAFSARRVETGAPALGRIEASSRSAFLNAQGEFALRGLVAGLYWPLFNVRSEGWYLRALTQAQPARGSAPAREIDLGRTGLVLKVGETLNGLTAVFASDGAGLTGRLIAAEGGTLPAQTHVHLIPAEAAAADNLLRYAETLVANREGRFGFRNLAPGRYHLYAEAVPASESRPSSVSFMALDQTARARLRRLAAGQPEIELKACERVEGYELRFK